MLIEMIMECPIRLDVAWRDLTWGQATGSHLSDHLPGIYGVNGRVDCIRAVTIILLVPG
jgi:hypothetical protein